MRTRLLIGIVSCQRYATRREACRASWVRALNRRQDVMPLFIVGDLKLDEPRVGGDTLYVPCDDSYECLPQKTMWLARWAAKNQVERLMKCDDDTFVCVSRIDSILCNNQDYIGFEVAPSVASGGAGYLLTNKAIDVLVSDLPANGRGAEDVLVAQMLRRQDIQIHHNREFRPWCDRVPTVWNEQFTAHYVQPVDMPSLQLSLERSPPQFIRCLDGHAEFGAIGVNGYRGFNANGRAEIEMPPDLARDEGAVFLSAHASSWISILLEQPARVSAFLDMGSKNSSARVTFSVNGEHLGDTLNGGERTAPVELQPGEHRLEAISRGQNARRYSVWHILPIGY